MNDLPAHMQIAKDEAESAAHQTPKKPKADDTLEVTAEGVVAKTDQSALPRKSV